MMEEPPSSPGAVHERLIRVSPPVDAERSVGTPGTVMFESSSRTVTIAEAGVPTE